MSSETCEANDHDSDSLSYRSHLALSVFTAMCEKEKWVPRREKYPKNLTHFYNLGLNLPELMESPALQLLHRLAESRCNGHAVQARRDRHDPAAGYVHLPNSSFLPSR